MAPKRTIMDYIVALIEHKKLDHPEMLLNEWQRLSLALPPLQLLGENEDADRGMDSGLFILIYNLSTEYLCYGNGTDNEREILYRGHGLSAGPDYAPGH
jgi:hypothetical protein